MFSDEQEQAIHTKANQVLVAAPPGSGKTRVIVGRVNYLISQGVDPTSIYAITFTNMAAQEMLSRVDYPIFIGTIHRLANSILKSNGVDTSRVIEEEQFDILLEQVKEGYIELPKITHLLVDELQDVGDVQFEFITKTLCAKNLFLVGDDCQSIYSFNGGNPENFTNFLNEPETTLYELTNNYRNAKSIYSFASSFIRGMQEVYHIQTVIKREGGEVYKEPYSDNRVIDLLQENEDYGNWFILTRTNAEVSEIRGLLHSEGIPSTTFKKSEKTFEELQEEMKKNTVKVLTIHSAKGLEADKVMIIGAKTFNNEEKRVCYVAITRARDKVYWFDKVKPKYAPRKYKQDINKGHATMTW